jgi:thiosulfate reductase cytochrome b subunit
MLPDRLEHPAIVRVCHWTFALSLLVLIGSGLEVFAAFPSFGEKLPASDLPVPPSILRIGGWLGGALQWHFTFAWLLATAMVIYFTYQVVSGNARQVLFARPDARGVWPMVRYYMLVGPKPDMTETYNPLQKLAYTIALLLIVVSLVTGFALYKPVQLSWSGLPVRRIPADTRLALCRDVRPACVHPGTSRDGGSPRLVQFRRYVDRRQRTPVGWVLLFQTRLQPGP